MSMFAYVWLQVGAVFVCVHCVQMQALSCYSILFLSQWIWVMLCVNICVCVLVVFISQWNGLPGLIFNKASGEATPSSCYWLWSTAHSVWRAGPGKCPECSCHKSCQFLWTNGWTSLSWTLKCKRACGQRAQPHLWTSKVSESDVYKKDYLADTSILKKDPSKYSWFKSWKWIILKGPNYAFCVFH